MALIENITVCRVRTPLVEPYVLSYGSLEVLDSVFCNVLLEDGQIGWGESTPLPGYSSSHIEDAWNATCAAAQTAIGKAAETAWFSPGNKDWFLTTALQTACEEACMPNNTVYGSVPLIGLLSIQSQEKALCTLEKARHMGHGEFKAKIGIQSASRESQIIQTLQDAMHEHEWLRLDANQGLDLDSALAIANVCDPAKIRYIEQPLPECDWKGMIELAKKSPVSLALDESITDMASIEKTKNSGAASFIKLKWMKQGGMKELSHLAKHAASNNLKIIFGNGVATTLNNRQEAIFWLNHLSFFGLPGEMNGFCKIRYPGPGLSFERGCAIVTPLEIDFLPYHPENLYASKFFPAQLP